MYGFKETGSLTQQGSGLKFGLNTGYITKFEYNLYIIQQKDRLLCIEFLNSILCYLSISF